MNSLRQIYSKFLLKNEKDLYIFSQNFSNSEDFQKRFEEIVWFTYRKNFMIDGFTTDSGWGCMIRSTQMLLCECMIRIYGLDKKDWIVHEYFVDTPDCPYSIYNFIKIAKKYGKYPGEWFEPTLSLLIVKDLIKSLENNLQFVIPLVARDGCLDISGIEENLKPQEREHDPLLNPIKKNRYLFLIPLRLGLDKLNLTVYGKSLIEILKFPQCVGIIGGKQSRSLFFIGSQNQKDLVFMDPHMVQNVSSDINTYVCKNIDTINLVDVNPSIAIGFLILSLSDFLDFKNRIKNYPIFSMSEKSNNDINILHDTVIELTEIE